MISYLIDNTITFAAGAILGPDIVTGGFTIDYLRPATGQALLARAHVLRAGTTHAVVRCDVSTPPARRAPRSYRSGSRHGYGTPASLRRDQHIALTAPGDDLVNRDGRVDRCLRGRSQDGRAESRKPAWLVLDEPASEAAMSRFDPASRHLVDKRWKDLAMRLQVIGGGLAGLVGAIRAAELGAHVDLYEAAGRLGGRGRATPGPYTAHDGPHVIYADGEMWRWLRRRSLVGAYRVPSASDLAALSFRIDGSRRRVPPRGLVRLLARRSLSAPVGTDFASWVSRGHGDRVARWAANLSGVAIFDADPGRLSAAFVWERLLRVTSFPSQVRYLECGWSGLIQRLAEHATALGVRIHLEAPVDELPSRSTIVATSLPAARRLLDDVTLAWESGSTALLDIAVIRRRGDAFIVSDLDAAGWCEDFSRTAPGLAPAGHALVQAQLPIRPEESRDAAQARLSALVDVAVPDAAARTVWRRRSSAHGRTGALDLPGRTWRDRPAIDRGDGIYLAGDQVAAPGLLGEVAWRSAVWAAEAAVRDRQRRRPARSRARAGVGVQVGATE